MKISKIAICIIPVVAFLGCANQPAAKTESGMPTWVMNPTPIDPEGIADVACVGDSSNITVDRQAAMASARTALAQQLDLKVKAMTETYSNRTDAASGSVSGTHFEQVSRQVTQQNLSGTRATKVDYIDVNGKRQLCAVVELSLKQRELFNKIITATNAKLSPQNEEVLYQEFKASQARDRMDSAFKNGQ